MAGPGTAITGPLLSGTKRFADGNGAANVGTAVLMQTATLTQNGLNDVSASFVVPQGSKLLDILVDTTTAWNSGTSDTLSVGIAAGGTDYASGVSVAAAGRVRPTFTAAQLAAMEDVGTNVDVVATVTPAGTAATAGTTNVTLVYAQTVQLTAGEA